SPYGMILTEWTKTSTGLELAVTIPVNTTATVYFPPSSGRQTIVDERNVRLNGLKMENGRAKIALGSGLYKFICTND
ncbi:MAG: alpha-L-rhamnosidase C-terminal domain-containing protein, partial [Bacteroidia bacterium]